MDPFVRLSNSLLNEGVDPEVVAIFGDDISAGEWVVGLEYLADTIVEYEIDLSNDTKRQIKALGDSYSVNRPSYLELTSTVS